MNPRLDFHKRILSREDLVYEALRNAILGGELRPNETINQGDVAQQMGVSIIPVRSAISRLVAEGLLQQDPYHSPHVPALNRDELEEILVICMHLELLALQQAIPKITPADIAIVRRLLERMHAAVASDDLGQYGALNREFHMALYTISRMPRLLRLIADLWDKADINRYRSMYDRIPELVQHTQADHARLVDLIEAGQGDAAIRLLEAHKAYSRQGFLAVVDETWNANG